MKRFLLISIAALPQMTHGGSCCLGSGPKSFVQLRHLQNYELGLAKNFKDKLKELKTNGAILSASEMVNVEQFKLIELFEKL